MASPGQEMVGASLTSQRGAISLCVFESLVLLSSPPALVWYGSSRLCSLGRGEHLCPLRNFALLFLNHTWRSILFCYWWRVDVVKGWRVYIYHKNKVPKSSSSNKYYEWKHAQASKSDLYWPECELQASWCRQPVFLSCLHQGTGSVGRLSLEPVAGTQWRLCGSDVAFAGSHNGPPRSTLWGQRKSHNKISGETANQLAFQMSG